MKHFTLFDNLLKVNFDSIQFSVEFLLYSNLYFRFCCICFSAKYSIGIDSLKYSVLGSQFNILIISLFWLYLEYFILFDCLRFCFILFLH